MQVQEGIPAQMLSPVRRPLEDRISADLTNIMMGPAADVGRRDEGVSEDLTQQPIGNVFSVASTWGPTWAGRSIPALTPPIKTHPRILQCDQGKATDLSAVSTKISGFQAQVA